MAVKKVEDPQKPPSKRGRKAKKINFDQTGGNNGGLSNAIDDIVILQLPISLEAIKKMNTITIFNKAEDFPEVSDHSVKQPTKDLFPEKQQNTYVEPIGSFFKKETTIYDCISVLPLEISQDSFNRVKMMKTNIVCWWCCSSFDTFPICMPERYSGKDDIFKVSGCFCSFNCVLAFKMRRNDSNCHLVSFMQKRLTGNFKTITKAPPPYCLEMFGGPISIEKYRECFITGDSIQILVSPMVFIPHMVEESRSKKMMQKSLDKFNSDIALNTHTISDAKTKQASKRSKIARAANSSSENVNTLDRAMFFAPNT